LSVREALNRLATARFAAPLDCPAAVARVHADSGVNFVRARARAGFARGHLLDVVVYLPGGTGALSETVAAEELVSMLVGEELFERWIGKVSATPTVRGGPLTVLNARNEEHAALPIEQLLETAHAAVRGLKSGLPPLPAEADAADWFAFELTPEPASDYAAQDDLIFCSTRVPELKKSFLRSEPFFSGRFASSDALFAYLKYEPAPQDTASRLAERAGLEAVILGALSPAQGVLLGLGLGVRYGYIDLAIADPDSVQARLLPELRRAGIGKRAWLLFCDTELELDYVPVYPDSPEPYRG
jgi:hypothetical protein